MCLSCRLRILLGGDGGSLCVLSYLILPTPYKAGLLLCPFYRWHLGSEWATEGYTESEKCGQGATNAVTEAPGCKEFCRRGRGSRKDFESSVSYNMKSRSYLE